MFNKFSKKELSNLVSDRDHKIDFTQFDEDQVYFPLAYLNNDFRMLKLIPKRDSRKL